MRIASPANIAGVLSLLALLPLASDAAGNKAIERGRYIAVVGGCNDCHTPNYASNAGKVPEREWLTGDKVGWNGPWGTTYPVNLRLYMQQMSADEWVRRARTLETRPPMPWFALRAMKEEDLRGLHAFIRSLGPAGEPAPAFLPPGQAPKGPAIVFPPPPPR